MDEGDEGVDETQNAEWAAQEKHVFILSVAGKPIYSRWVANSSPSRMPCAATARGNR